MRIAGVGYALPAHYYAQTELLTAFRRLWGARFHNPARLEQIHHNVLVGGRHLALPIDEYEKLQSFGDANDAFIDCAVELGESAIEAALHSAGLAPRDIDHLCFVSVTGIATPSIDARLINRMGLRTDLKRTPIFGLGCVAGAVGLTRVVDFVRAWPRQAAVLLSVELCSLTLQREDLSIANIIASGLFGDGAAAVVVLGAEREASGPCVIATRSIFYPGTEHVMGWDVTAKGFRVVLSGEVPAMAERVRPDVDSFLADHGLTLADIDRFICHPGGPKVLRAYEQALELPDGALAVTWDCLRRTGNLSSASVLLVLAETLENNPAPAGGYGLMIAMGPGFCAELLLLQW